MSAVGVKIVWRGMWVEKRMGVLAENGFGVLLVVQYSGFVYGY